LSAAETPDSVFVDATQTSNAIFCEMSARDFEDHCWKDVIPADVLQIYRAYIRELKIGPSPALVMIDQYNLAFEGGARPILDLQKDYPSSCGEHAWASIEPTKRLLAAARAAGLPVFFSTQETRNEALPARSPATLRQKNTFDPKVFEIYHAFAPLPGETIIYKQRASIFYGTAFQAHLSQLGVRSLIFSGESTSGCLRASVVDGYSHGYHASVVEECCYDRSQISHKVSLFDLHHKYADVLNIDTVVANLAQIKKV
jgi:maleamate amidohydrolase